MTRQVKLSPRIASEDVDLQGFPIQAGESMFLLVGGANRDPAVFEHPNSFDTPVPTRANTSASVPVCTPAWERRWRAWNSISACSRCSNASPS